MITGSAPQVSSQARIHVHERKKDRADFASSARHSGSSLAADTKFSTRTSNSPMLIVISILSRLDILPHYVASRLRRGAGMARRWRINPVAIDLRSRL